MARLEDVPVDALQRALDEVDGGRPTMRLMVAIAHKQGVPQTDLAEWYGLSRKTVYNWFRRMEEMPIERAVRDDRRPGRPTKATADQLGHLAAVLEDPPRAAGLDSGSWTPGLLQRYVADVLGVEYSRRTCRRLLDDLR